MEEYLEQLSRIGRTKHLPKHYDVLWKGRLDLKRLKWEFDPSWTYDLPPKLEQSRPTIWHQAKKAFPHIYDGELLCLTSYHLETNELKLSVGTIRFSQMMTHERLDIPIHDGYGSLGVQVAIFTNDRRHLLVGERSQKSDYRPGWWTIPGGIFEITDVNDSVTKAVNREMREEVALKLRQNFILCAMLKMHPHTSTALLVEAQLAEAETIDASRPVRGNEEWEEKMLRWLPCPELPHLNRERIFDGLDFIAADWRAFLKKERNLFFD